MTLRLLVDESGDSRTLRRLLAAAGHTVVTPIDVGLLRARDPKIFAYAQAHGLVILTRNPRDFLRLHAEH
ncbi:MAG: DUF5615 family PIN-like protein, partial [Chloroflexi bacterium]|nr:DUF5615 family PIN-like protein [Chloroflexota bacterium]